MKTADFPFWLRAIAVLALILFAINLMIFLPAFTTTVPTLTAREIGGWVGSLVSTFLGAFFAFQFGIRQRARERAQQEVTAGNLALAALIQMWESQFQFRKDVIRGYGSRDDAWLNMPVGSRLTSIPLELNKSDLGFLLEAAPQTWHQAVLEEHRFNGLAHRIDLREKLILEQVWPLLEKGGVVMNNDNDEEAIKKLLGPGTVKQMHVYSAAIIQHIDENIASSKKAIWDCRIALKSIYPQQKFIKFSFPDDAS